MNRTWWKNRQALSAKALKNCISRFTEKYPQTWRKQIVKLEELELYFLEMHKIELHTSNQKGGSTPFGFRLLGQSWKVTRNRKYQSILEARWAALATAFTLIETESMHHPMEQVIAHKQVRRQPK